MSKQFVENPQHKIFVPWAQLHPHLLLETTLGGLGEKENKSQGHTMET